MKRIIIWSSSKDPSVIPVEALIKKGEIEVPMWVAWKGNKTFRTKHFLYVPELMLKDLALQNKRSDTCYPCDDEQLAKDLCQFMDTYSRVNYSKGMDYFDHVNLFHLYYNYFTNIIKTKKIDAVVYFCAPHVGVDFILYLVAKTLGVQVVITIQSFVPNRFYYINDLQDFGAFETTPSIGSPIKLTIPEGFKKNHFYMDNVKHKRGWLIDKFFVDILRAIFPTRQPISWTGVVHKQAGRRLYKKYYKKYITHNIDFSKKFVYFPMQLQPEITTSILGDEFSDQLLAIECLRKVLPENWTIYAKENPKQGFQQRNRFFYERVKRIHNCVYVSDKIDTYDLIEKCQFVASITSTACWEAISGGKPALIFGNPWFKKLPGVISYKKDLSLDEIINTRFNHEELEMAYSQLMSKTIPGIVDVRYNKIYENYDELENGRLLTDFLSKVLKV